MSSWIRLTNADRIRGMTDEELAHLLRDIAMEAVDFVVGKRESVRFPMSSYVGTWLDWLKQEAKD